MRAARVAIHQFQQSAIGTGIRSDPEKAVFACGPHTAITILQNPADNPHATLVTLFLNAIQEVISSLGIEFERLGLANDMRLIMNYIPVSPTSSPDEMNTEMIKIMVARELARDVEKHFEV